MRELGDMGEVAEVPEVRPMGHVRGMRDVIDHQLAHQLADATGSLGSRTPARRYP